MPSHFYTTNPNERQNAIQNGFRDEGISCFVFTAPAPARRLYSVPTKMVAKFLSRLGTTSTR